MRRWPEHDWSDPSFASGWEALADEANPVRRQQLALLLALLRWQRPRTMLDLGVGSGLVAEPALDALPEARLIGVDSSAAMLALARERLDRFEPRVSLMQADLSRAVLTECLDQPVDAIFSVQTLHNLEPAAKLRAQGDRPVTLATELRWLDDSGFDAACLQCLGNRAVVAGRRRG
jgi:SAM-dependent methyltransferase